MDIISNLKHIGKYNPNLPRLHQPGARDGAIIIAMIARMLLSLAPTFNIEGPGKGRSSAWH